ncbi:5-formyltetrahydrofolate cyclo-ligase [Legionella jordanis]|uniref:5-formyltetrahydrofolate cyclo-ligase n=1 Tax=Legionella jordanis TaxID=456 RepID=A0A0W0VDX7_9GAMM|nr:5-formyltetrahydrofolate cyclo-ligase [Legionella jordanis]KTD18355.1 5-formyltetrahydrofolate cyclo-ligase [Legionella jordanis]RMX05266.1 5-formyltetrahydrofolate cyclo-ligase [Legionella jordanis]RMX20883.1 5-formyltetrahydrofolate cyclo-ligase [Legionella jordanis]VEH13299.1 5-formyltetrahydrofolate cyclo-ligase [Legionella jordanis]HAT8713647.1 5-formyltetrahydrofolate cyclo-ligase [Legionella jordanis]
MTNRFRLALRRSLKQIRANLSSDYQQIASAQVSKHISTLDEYRYAKNIGLYKPVKGEIDLRGLWRSASSHGKYCYFPVLNENNTLSFLPATPATSFIENRFGIPEPAVSRDKSIAIGDLDIIFMPLLAFDDRCTRLGMGAGYYDRTLENESHPLLIGVAYEFQHMFYIEPQAWDIPLSAVVTPNAIYWSKK